MRSHALRTPAGPPGPEASVAKLVWAGWHRRLGELAMDVRGIESTVAPDGLDEWQRLFLFSRADTIYGGSDEIQRDIIADTSARPAHGSVDDPRVPARSRAAGRQDRRRDGRRRHRHRLGDRAPLP